jgi:ferredoxin-type protein NapH
MRSSADGVAAPMPRRRLRAWTQTGFFALFVLAPPLDLFRIDLTRGHAVLLGQDWTLGIDALIAGSATPAETALSLVLRGFLPVFGGAALFLWLAWRYGRFYCGWLCPHFSVVELINGLMRRAIGRPTLWERTDPTPAGGPDRPWSLVTLLAVAGFAFLWALALLTYLLPPAEIYGNLLSGSLTRNQALFLGVGTLVFATDFLLARHLFCRFGCAVGLFQSLAWMGNDRALVVGFDTRRARACGDCPDACDQACPMRLKPRTIKRRMFACTQCTQCIEACTSVQGGRPEASLLRWVEGEGALPVVTGRPARHGTTASRSGAELAARPAVEEGRV